jgi:hypothetical protein
MSRSTQERLVCRKCPEEIVLKAPSIRLGPDVPLRQYIDKMAEQWGWEMVKGDERCPIHHSTCEAGR